MGRRNRRWTPPLGGPCPNVGPQMSESVSDDEKAGKPMPPLVEVRPAGPPLEITEAGPMSPEPEVPFDRAAALARLQSAFAALSDDELQVTRLRMLGVPYVDISEALELQTDEVEKLWKKVRRKLGTLMFAATETAPPANTINSVPPPNTGTPQETEGTSPV
jgi:DNA-directed RNA polymerase specialized sigma24 family protein